MENLDVISKEMVGELSEYYNSDITNKVMADAVIKNGINDTALNHEAIIKNHCIFSDEVDQMKITNQKHSGRCWMFAGLNTLRYRIYKKYQLKDNDFELSQSYTMFWDKIEKANFFLENMIACVDEKIDSRIMMWLLENAIPDAGQWDMFVNIVNKYGVVPKYVMPETYHSSDSAKMNAIFNAKLREYAVSIRKMHADGKSTDELRKAKKDMLKDFYNIVCHFLGEPAKTFDFEYRDKDNNFHRDSSLTPVEFFNKYIGKDVLNQYVSIINAPTSDKPFNKTYTVKFLGNVKGGKDVLYLNLDMDTLKKLAVEQIKHDEPIWFGCNTQMMTERTMGIMDLNVFNYAEVLGTKFNMTKAETLDYRESCLTHAMVLDGVNIVDGKPERWKVQNSWSTEKGVNGYFIMSDEWFEKYAYQVVINKKYLSDEQKKNLSQKPIELQPWDPMGALALMRTYDGR